jgi:carboxylesterase type B
MKDFVDAHPEIIVVSVNYRLGLFGYLHTPAISGPETNAGLRDQWLAIEWVHKNIAAFGGDPNRLVIGGQSAGAASSAGYLYAHPKDSLINGVILMSGQATFMSGALPPEVFGSSNYDNPLPAFANATGCSLEGNNYIAQLNCLRGKSTEELFNIVVGQNFLNFIPYVDNRTVFSLEDYHSKGISGKFAKVVCYFYIESSMIE